LIGVEVIVKIDDQLEYVSERYVLDSYFEFIRPVRSAMKALSDDPME